MLGPDECRLLGCSGHSSSGHYLRERGTGFDDSWQGRVRPTPDFVTEPTGPSEKRQPVAGSAVEPTQKAHNE